MREMKAVSYARGCRGHSYRQKTKVGEEGIKCVRAPADGGRKLSWSHTGGLEEDSLIPGKAPSHPLFPPNMALFPWLLFVEPSLLAAVVLSPPLYPPIYTLSIYLFLPLSVLPFFFCCVLLCQPVFLLLSSSSSSSVPLTLSLSPWHKQKGKTLQSQGDLLLL